MRIGIDATGVWRDGEKLGGVVNYTVEITRSLVNVDTENEYIIYCRNDVSDELADLSPRASLQVLRSRSRKLLQQTRLPLAALSDRLDLMFFPLNSASLISPCKSVVTIHDLHPYVIPERFAVVHGSQVHGSFLRSAASRWYWRRMLEMASRRISRIVAVSDVTKKDIETIFRIPGEKIDVVHEGVDKERFGFHGHDKGSASFREEHDLPERYILCMGTHAYKNLEGSIRSFHHVRKCAQQTLSLVICGRTGNIGHEIYELVRELDLERSVIFTGFFPEEHLSNLYRNAELLLFPSFYEGFGLPVLEAYACGTPVVASTAGALPEVAGDAALLTDPENPSEIASAVLKLLTDSELREKKRRLGYKRVEQFSWEKSARKTIEVFEKAASAK